VRAAWWAWTAIGYLKIAWIAWTTVRTDADRRRRIVFQCGLLRRAAHRHVIPDEALIGLAGRGEVGRTGVEPKRHLAEFQDGEIAAIGSAETDGNIGFGAIERGGAPRR